MKKSIVFALPVLVLSGWWIATAPPDYIKIAPPFRELMPEGPREARAATTKRDFIAANHRGFPSDLPGYDEVILREDLARAYVTAMDGWFWEVNLKTGAARRFVKPPLNPAGARLDPLNPDRLFFCAARLYGEKYRGHEPAGVFVLNLRTRKIKPVALRVPTLKPRASSAKPGRVHPIGTGPAQALGDSGAGRKIAFCNDLDISRDGKRVYFSEPFAYPGASMGAGAFREAISLGRNGFLWMADLETKRVSLVARDFTFVDGVLLEYPDADATRESSVLISETVKFSLLRFHLRGRRGGEHDVLWHSLPGLPDGLDRDAQGRIWIGMVKTRTPVITFVHRNPFFLKQLLLRLPHKLLPVPKKTGMMVLSPDATEILLNTVHDGSKVHDISVVVPGRRHLYPAVFRKEQRGFHRLEYPAKLR